ncbi:MAG TPA: hypothetical protein VFH65_11805 [Mycobacterium sp.]|nr:hypothetical protein [Mycobacterium sp.]
MSSPDPVSVPSEVEDGFVVSGFDEFAGLAPVSFAPGEFGKPADEESFGDEVVPESSATAIPGTVATEAPTPSATASAPTCPMYFAYPIFVPPTKAQLII